MVSSLLERLSSSDDIRHVLSCAEAQELNWLEGVKLNEDLVTLKADIRDGLWTITLEVEHGTVTYRNLDKAGYLITITTMPNTKYLNGKEKLSQDEVTRILIEHSNTVAIDLKNISTLKAAKEAFRNDYVLKHIPLANPTQDTAARLVIWHIRAYRKLFMDYSRKFGFLWQGTGYSSARELSAAMRDGGFI